MSKLLAGDDLRVAGQFFALNHAGPNSGLALTFFHPAEFITQKADHGYGNNMNDKPSTVKKLQGHGQGH
jgi:hypothetical protein